MKRKKVIVLGSTGSIGENTLDVLRALSPSFTVVALACGSNVGRLAAQVREFSPQAVAVAADPVPGAVEEPGDLRGVRVYRGEDGLLQMLAEIPAELVVNGISGAAGLRPSVAALQRGMDLALANKETIVMAGPLVSELARRNGSRLLPIDSEHHALFHLLRGRKPEEVQEIILTASGGAFRELSYEQLGEVSVEDAVSHPNWDMGAKITVDSATMANKGLEVIEAHYLFELPISAIKVLIHPQSYIHSLIRTIDGFLYAQLSQPDMRLPIQDALTWPEMKSPCVEPFQMTGRHFSFEPVDPRKYRLLDLAYEAAEKGGGYPIVYNAANEVAVQRFLDHGISFLEIPRLVEETLLADWSSPAASLEEILQVDREARSRAQEILDR